MSIIFSKTQTKSGNPRRRKKSIFLFFLHVVIVIIIVVVVLVVVVVVIVIVTVICHHPHTTIIIIIITQKVLILHCSESRVWHKQYFLSEISLFVKQILILTESALLANSVYKSRCPCVCLSVCVPVHMSPLVRYCLNVFLHPFPKVLGS